MSSPGGSGSSFRPCRPAGCAKGMEWTDTTEYHLTADAFPGSERVVTTYHAEPSDAPGTRKGITLRSDGSYDRKGTRNQGDQELQMQATGTRPGRARARPRRRPHFGARHRGRRHDHHRAHRGQTVPVKQSGSYAITSTSSR